MPLYYFPSDGTRREVPDGQENLATEQYGGVPIQNDTVDMSFPDGTTRVVPLKSISDAQMKYGGTFGKQAVGTMNAPQSYESQFFKQYPNWIGPTPRQPLDSSNAGKAYLAIQKANEAGRAGFWEGANVLSASSIPYYNSIDTLLDAGSALKTVQRIKQNPSSVSEDEVVKLNAYLAKQDRLSNATTLGTVGNVIKGSLVFGAEIASGLALSAVALGNLLTGPDPTDVITTGAAAASWAGIRKTAAEKGTRVALQEAISGLRSAVAKTGERAAVKVMGKQMAETYEKQLAGKGIREAFKMLGAKEAATVAVGKVGRGIADTIGMGTLSLVPKVAGQVGVSLATEGEPKLASQQVKQLYEELAAGQASAESIGFLTALSDDLIENVSEMSGGYLMKLPGLSQLEKAGQSVGAVIKRWTQQAVESGVAKETAQQVEKKLLSWATMTGALSKLSSKGLNYDNAMSMFKTMAWDGVMGEMMEERFGGFLRGLTGLEGGNAGVMNAIDQAIPDLEQAKVEFLAFSFPMVFSGAMHTAVNWKNLDRNAKINSILTDLSDSKFQGDKNPEALGVDAKELDSAEVNNALQTVLDDKLKYDKATGWANSLTDFFGGFKVVRNEQGGYEMVSDADYRFAASFAPQLGRWMKDTYNRANSEFLDSGKNKEEADKLAREEAISRAKEDIRTFGSFVALRASGAVDKDGKITPTEKEEKVNKLVKQLTEKNMILYDKASNQLFVRPDAVYQESPETSTGNTIHNAPRALTTEEFQSLYERGVRPNVTTKISSGIANSLREVSLNNLDAEATKMASNLLREEGKEETTENIADAKIRILNIVNQENANLADKKMLADSIYAKAIRRQTLLPQERAHLMALLGIAPSAPDASRQLDNALIPTQVAYEQATDDTIREKDRVYIRTGTTEAGMGAPLEARAYVVNKVNSNGTIDVVSAEDVGSEGPVTTATYTPDRLQKVKADKILFSPAGAYDGTAEEVEEFLLDAGYLKEGQKIRQAMIAHPYLTQDNKVRYRVGLGAASSADGKTLYLQSFGYHAAEDSLENAFKRYNIFKAMSKKGAAFDNAVKGSADLSHPVVQEVIRAARKAIDGVDTKNLKTKEVRAIAAAKGLNDFELFMKLTAHRVLNQGANKDTPLAAVTEVVAKYMGNEWSAKDTGLAAKTRAFWVNEVFNGRPEDFDAFYFRSTAKPVGEAQQGVPKGEKTIPKVPEKKAEAPAAEAKKPAPAAAAQVEKEIPGPEAGAKQVEEQKEPMVQVEGPEAGAQPVSQKVTDTVKLLELERLSSNELKAAKEAGRLSISDFSFDELSQLVDALSPKAISLDIENISARSRELNGITKPSGAEELALAKKVSEKIDKDIYPAVKLGQDYDYQYHSKPEGSGVTVKDIQTWFVINKDGSVYKKSNINDGKPYRYKPFYSQEQRDEAVKSILEVSAELPGLEAGAVEIPEAPMTPVEGTQGSRLVKRLKRKRTRSLEEREPKQLKPELPEQRVAGGPPEEIMLPVQEPPMEHIAGEDTFAVPVTAEEEKLIQVFDDPEAGAVYIETPSDKDMVQVLSGFDDALATSKAQGSILGDLSSFGTDALPEEVEAPDFIETVADLALATGRRDKVNLARDIITSLLDVRKTNKAGKNDQDTASGAESEEISDESDDTGSGLTLTDKEKVLASLRRFAPFGKLLDQFEGMQGAGYRRMMMYAKQPEVEQAFASKDSPKKSPENFVKYINAPSKSRNELFIKSFYRAAMQMSAGKPGTEQYDRVVAALQGHLVSMVAEFNKFNPHVAYNVNISEVESGALKVDLIKANIYDLEAQIEKQVTDTVALWTRKDWETFRKRFDTIARRNGVTDEFLKEARLKGYSRPGAERQGIPALNNPNSKDLVEAMNLLEEIGGLPTNFLSKTVGAGFEPEFTYWSMMYEFYNINQKPEFTGVSKFPTVAEVIDRNQIDARVALAATGKDGSFLTRVFTKSPLGSKSAVSPIQAMSRNTAHPYSYKALYNTIGSKTALGWSQDDHLLGALKDYFNQLSASSGGRLSMENSFATIGAVRINRNQVLHDDLDADARIAVARQLLRQGWVDLGVFGDKSSTRFPRIDILRKGVFAKDFAEYEKLYNEAHPDIKPVLMPPAEIKRMIQDMNVPIRDMYSVAQTNERAREAIDNALFAVYFYKFRRMIDGDLEFYLKNGDYTKEFMKRTGQDITGGHTLKFLDRKLKSLIISNKELSKLFDGMYVFGSKFSKTYADEVGSVLARGRFPYSIKNHVRMVEAKEGNKLRPTLMKFNGVNLESFRDGISNKLLKRLGATRQAPYLNELYTNLQKLMEQSGADFLVFQETGVKTGDTTIAVPVDNVALPTGNVELATGTMEVPGSSFIVSQFLTGELDPYWTKSSKQGIFNLLPLDTQGFISKLDSLRRDLALQNTNLDDMNSPEWAMKQLLDEEDIFLRDIMDGLKNGVYTVDSPLIAQKINELKVRFIEKTLQRKDLRVGMQLVASGQSREVLGTEVDATGRTIVPWIRVNLGRGNPVEMQGGRVKGVLFRSDKNDFRYATVAGFDPKTGKLVGFAKDDPQYGRQDAIDFILEVTREELQFARLKGIAPRLTYADMFRPVRAENGAYGNVDYDQAAFDLDASGKGFAPVGAPDIRLDTKTGDVLVDTLQVDDIRYVADTGWVIPGSYVQSTRIPADALQSHPIARAYSNFAGSANFIMLDDKTREAKGADLDGDKEYVAIMSGTWFDNGHKVRNKWSDAGIYNRKFMLMADEYREPKWRDWISRPTSLVVEMFKDIQRTLRDDQEKNPETALIRKPGIFNSFEFIKYAQSVAAGGKKMLGVAAKNNVTTDFMVSNEVFLKQPITLQLTNRDGSTIDMRVFRSREGVQKLNGSHYNYRQLMKNIVGTGFINNSADDNKEPLMAYAGLSKRTIGWVITAIRNWDYFENVDATQPFNYEQILRNDIRPMVEAMFNTLSTAQWLRDFLRLEAKKYSPFTKDQDKPTFGQIWGEVAYNKNFQTGVESGEFARLSPELQAQVRTRAKEIQKEQDVGPITAMRRAMFQLTPLGKWKQLYDLSSEEFDMSSWTDLQAVDLRSKARTVGGFLAIRRLLTRLSDEANPDAPKPYRYINPSNLEQSPYAEYAYTAAETVVEAFANDWLNSPMSAKLFEEYAQASDTFMRDDDYNTASYKLIKVIRVQALEAMAGKPFQKIYEDFVATIPTRYTSQHPMARFLRTDATQKSQLGLPVKYHGQQIPESELLRARNEFDKLPFDEQVGLSAYALYEYGPSGSTYRGGFNTILGNPKSSEFIKSYNQALRGVAANWRNPEADAVPDDMLEAFTDWISFNKDNFPFGATTTKGLKAEAKEQEKKAAERAAVAKPTPEFDKLPSYQAGQKTLRYAGIGSRETPANVMIKMREIAQYLNRQGYTLLSGGAQGADSAFEQGAGTKKQIFRATATNPRTIAIAKEIHPRPQALNEYTIQLMARNTFQVFGSNLDSPVDFVLAWTQDGAESTAERTVKTGGTGQAIDMASRKGIPVINLAKAGWEQRIREVIGMTQAPAAPVTGAIAPRLTSIADIEREAIAIIRSKKGDNKYVFLRSQLPDFKDSLVVDDKKGERVAGSVYRGINIVADYYYHKTLKDPSGKDNVDILFVDSADQAQQQFNNYIAGGAKQFTRIDFNTQIPVTGAVAPESTQAVNQILTGDLFSVPNTKPVITTNTDGVMGAGVAKSAAQRNLIPVIRRTANGNVVHPHTGVKDLTGAVLFPVKQGSWNTQATVARIQESATQLDQLLKANPNTTYVMPPPGIGAGTLERGTPSFNQVINIVAKLLRENQNLRLITPDDATLSGSPQGRLSPDLQTAKARNEAFVAGIRGTGPAVVTPAPAAVTPTSNIVAGVDLNDPALQALASELSQTLSKPTRSLQEDQAAVNAALRLGRELIRRGIRTPEDFSKAMTTLVPASAPYVNLVYRLLQLNLQEIIGQQAPAQEIRPSQEVPSAPAVTPAPAVQPTPTEPKGYLPAAVIPDKIVLENGLFVNATSGQVKALQEMVRVAQKAMDERTSPGETIVIKGYAGVGKTTILKEMLRRLRLKYSTPTQAGKISRIALATPTHAASGVMRLLTSYWARNTRSAENVAKKIKTETNTVASLLGVRLKRPTDNKGRLRPGYIETKNEDGSSVYIPDPSFPHQYPPSIADQRLVIIDESSMLPDGYLDVLEKWQKAINISLIFLGDPGQLPQVRAGQIIGANAPDIGKIFTDKYANKTLELTEIMRQSVGNPLIDVLTALRRGIFGSVDQAKQALLLPDMESVSPDGSGFVTAGSAQSVFSALKDSITVDLFRRAPLALRIYHPTNNGVGMWNQLIYKHMFPQSQRQVEAGALLRAYQNFKIETRGDKPMILASGLRSYIKVLPFNNSDDFMVLNVDDQIKTIPQNTSQYFSKVQGRFVSLEAVIPGDGLKGNETNRIFLIEDNTENRKNLYDAFQALDADINAAFKNKNFDLAWDLDATRDVAKAGIVSFKTISATGEGSDAETGRGKITKAFDLGYSATVHKGQGATNLISVMDIGATVENKMFQTYTKLQLLYVGLSRASKTAIGIMPSSTGEMSQNTVNILQRVLDTAQASAAMPDFIEDSSKYGSLMSSNLNETSGDTRSLAELARSAVIGTTLAVAPVRVGQAAPPPAIERQVSELEEAKKMIVKYEGRELTRYWDQGREGTGPGSWAIGPGVRLIEGNRALIESTGANFDRLSSGRVALTPAQFDQLVESAVMTTLNKAMVDTPELVYTSPKMQAHVAQLYHASVYPNVFKKSFAALQSGDYNKAAAELRDSKLYRNEDGKFPGWVTRLEETAQVFEAETTRSLGDEEYAERFARSYFGNANLVPSKAPSFVGWYNDARGNLAYFKVKDDAIKNGDQGTEHGDFGWNEIQNPGDRFKFWSSGEVVWTDFPSSADSYFSVENLFNKIYPNQSPKHMTSFGAPVREPTRSLESLPQSLSRGAYAMAERKLYGFTLTPDERLTKDKAAITNKLREINKKIEPFREELKDKDTFDGIKNTVNKMLKANAIDMELADRIMTNAWSQPDKYTRTPELPVRDTTPKGYEQTELWGQMTPLDRTMSLMSYQQQLRQLNAPMFYGGSPLAHKMQMQIRNLMEELMDRESTFQEREAMLYGNTTSDKLRKIKKNEKGVLVEDKGYETWTGEDREMIRRFFSAVTGQMEGGDIVYGKQPIDSNLPEVQTVEAFEEEFRNSDTYRKLLATGRTADMFDIKAKADEYSKQYDAWHAEVNGASAWAFMEEPFVRYWVGYAPHIYGQGFQSDAFLVAKREWELLVRQSNTANENFLLPDSHRQRFKPGETPKESTSEQRNMFRSIMRERAEIEGVDYDMDDVVRIDKVNMAKANSMILQQLEALSFARHRLKKEHQTKELATIKILRRVVNNYQNKEWTRPEFARDKELKTYAAAYNARGFAPKTMDALELRRIYVNDIQNGMLHKVILNSMLLYRDADGNPLVIAVPNEATEAEDPYGVIKEEIYDESAKNLANMLNVVHNPSLDSRMQVANMASKKRADLLKNYVAMESPYDSITEFLVLKGDSVNLMKMLVQLPAQLFIGGFEVLGPLMRLTQWSKGTSVSWSFFFPVAGLESLVAGTGLSRQNILFRQRQAAKQMFEMLKGIENNDPYWTELLSQFRRNGAKLDIRAITDDAKGIVDSDIDKFSESIGVYFGEAKGKRAKDIARLLTGRQISDFYFKKFFPAIKLWAANELYKTQKIKRPDLTDAQIMRKIAPIINDAYGGQNWYRYIWATPRTLQFLNLLMFAPNWTLSAFNIAGGGLLTGKLFKNYMSETNKDFVFKTNWPAMAVFALFALPNLYQAAIWAASQAVGAGDPDDKPFTFMNEQGRKTYIDITPLSRVMPGYTGDPTGRRRTYARFGKQAYEVIDGWLTEAPAQFLRKMSQPARYVWSMATGQSPGSDWNLEFKGKGLAGWFLTDEPGLAALTTSRIGYAAQAFIPMSVVNLIKNPDQWATTFAVPVAKGMSAGKATEALIKVFNTYADQQEWSKIKGRADTRAKLDQLAPALIDAARRNGYDTDKIINTAKANVLGRLYKKFMAALDSQNQEEMNELAKSILRVGGTVKGLKTSVTSRRQNYGLAGASSEELIAIEEAFK